MRAAAKNPEDRFPECRGLRRRARGMRRAGAPHRSPSAARCPSRRSARAEPSPPGDGPAPAPCVALGGRRRGPASLIAWGLAAALSSGAHRRRRSAPRCAITASGYDPQGDGTENARRRTARDRREPDTAWYTEQYGGSRDLRGHQAGRRPAARGPRRLAAHARRSAVADARRANSRSACPASSAAAAASARHPDRCTDQSLALPATAAVGPGRVDRAPRCVIRRVTGVYWAGISEVSVWGVPKT